MKLAEALILRADCQKRIAQLKSRLLVNSDRELFETILVLVRFLK